MANVLGFVLLLFVVVDVGVFSVSIHHGAVTHHAVVQELILAQGGELFHPSQFFRQQKEIVVVVVVAGCRLSDPAVQHGQIVANNVGGRCGIHAHFTKLKRLVVTPFPFFARQGTASNVRMELVVSRFHKTDPTAFFVVVVVVVVGGGGGCVVVITNTGGFDRKGRGTAIARFKGCDC